MDKPSVLASAGDDEKTLPAPSSVKCITIVRHGKSAHQQAYGKAMLREMPELLEAYDALGICKTSTPPTALVAHVADARLLIASPLARARESAAALIHATGCREFLVDDLFREVELPVPRSKGPDVRIDPFLWVAILRLAWLIRIYTGEVQSPRKIWHRALAAASRLDELSVAQGHIVLVGHSLFNLVLGFALLRRGWNSRVRPQRHWDFTTFLGAT